MMAFAYVDCPVCGEEICFHLTSGPGGYPGESVVEVEEIERVCACDLTVHLDKMTDEAIEGCDWSPSDINY
jgi:hypothetical protein